MTPAGAPQTPIRSPRRVSRVGLLGLTGLCALLVLSSGCTPPNPRHACPLLPPGALALHPTGDGLDPERPAVEGQAAAGALVAHPIWVPPGATVTVSGLGHGQALALVTYGPRNVLGGFPHCLALEAGASPSVRFASEEGGEYLVLAGTLPGGEPLAYTLTTTCDGCDGAPRCPTLAEQGCADVRCDGELLRVGGCLTCTCSEALCGPDRRPGPAGSCVLPACDCAEAPDAPVCGADGETWPNACEASCAGMPVAREGPCAPCPLACETPCFGRRVLSADGCPTCDCMPTFAPDAASCAACPLDGAPVCGSDGVTYPNACRARCAGAKLLYMAACTDACDSAPPDCPLDCPLGLRPVRGGAHCLACACLPPPSGCALTADGPLCATLPAIGETTVGSACLALALGATSDATRWGACGVRCASDEDCPATSRCQLGGYLDGRCLLEDTECGCSPLLDPICGADGDTWANACLARCAGVRVVHRGACCAQAPTCDAVAWTDTRGCPTTCGAPRPADCATNAAAAEACLPDGSPVDGTACEAHARGQAAFPEACP